MRSGISLWGLFLIYLMAKNVEYFFLWLLALFKSLDKKLFRAFAHFLIGLSFYYWVVIVLCMSEQKSLIISAICRNFTQFCGLSFIFLKVSFEVYKHVKFWLCLVYLFFSFLLVFWLLYIRNCLIHGCKNLCLWFLRVIVSLFIAFFFLFPVSPVAHGEDP